MTHRDSDTRTSADLVGHSFPGGAIAIHGWENWLFCDAVLVDPATYRDPSMLSSLGYERPVVHPVLAFIGALRGAGVKQAEILALANFDDSEGPLFGEQTMMFEEPIFEEVRYEAAGSIVKVEQKTGKAIGPFDAVTFECSLSLSSRRILTCTAMLILPRRSAR